MLRLVDQMTEIPGECALCGGNPPGDDGRPQKAIWAEGVDIDWGSALYICGECSRVIADLIGRVPQDDHDKLVQRYQKLDGEHTKLLRRHGRLRSNARAVVSGEKAKKEIKRG